jgi:hypothetical protein
MQERDVVGVEVASVVDKDGTQRVTTDEFEKGFGPAFLEMGWAVHGDELVRASGKLSGLGLKRNLEAHGVGLAAVPRAAFAVACRIWDMRMQKGGRRAMVGAAFAVACRIWDM